LRGFTLKSEQAANNLMGLLDRVSSALGVTTNEILQQRGVVGDFHGDAAMGFWGWPLEQPDRAERACAAAIEIQNRFAGFAKEPGHPLNDFQVGVGIATGRAVAGRIGTSDQVKVTVFGPVVNLAARLESLNQQLRTGILVDGRTDQLLREMARSGRGIPFRVRRLAVIQPYGMESAIAVSQVLPSFGPICGLTDEDLIQYEKALDAFTVGRWQEAFELLHSVPADDTAKDFLTVFIAQHKRHAPTDWRGVIAMHQK
jgi:adenylate cyclase